MHGLFQLGGPSCLFWIYPRKCIRHCNLLHFRERHAARLLDQFAPSTVLRYITAWQSFQSTLLQLRLQLSDLQEATLADILINLSTSKSGPGCQVMITTLRWVAQLADVEALSGAWSPMITSFLKSRIPQELKESIPFSLYVVTQMERRILTSSCSIVEILVLGAMLACVWGGLRFADAQRCSFKSFCCDGETFRASCWRTKTSHKGQPWGFITSGFMSLGSHNWVWRWLRTLDEVVSQAKTIHVDMPCPDFLFCRVSDAGSFFPLEPMEYAEALYWIRRMSSLPWKSQTLPSNHWTAHSMKSTLLSWGSQLASSHNILPEERLLQGHHRQSQSASLRTYSRDDVFAQLSFQTKLIAAVRQGARFRTAQHRGSQLPLQEPVVSLEFFRKAASQEPWSFFQFDAAPVLEEIVQEDTDLADDASSNSTSSSSSSSSKGEAVESLEKSTKKPFDIQLLGSAEEALIASCSTIQHALVPASGPDCIAYQGQHFAAACGVRLDASRITIASNPSHDHRLCQRRACTKAWQALLL